MRYTHKVSSAWLLARDSNILPLFSFIAFVLYVPSSAIGFRPSICGHRLSNLVGLGETNKRKQQFLQFDKRSFI